MRLGEKCEKKRVLVAFDGQELPVFNAGKLLGFALRILLFMTMTTY